ncbi:DUF3592 domain-containing protein [Kribbella sp. NBC_01505]|uniref:DUF3592 domain-containing protein n=1 Tax=Kribbella sp. NBC_01505 TaxID=2903580 RepID=UPI003866445D
MVVALVFLVVGLMQLSDLYWLRHRGEVVTARVVSVEVHPKGRDTIKVTYVPRGGQAVAAKTSNYHHAEVGKTIEIRYDREKPDRMQAADWTLSYTFTLLMYGGAGALVVLFALLDVRFNITSRLRGIVIRPLGGRSS